MKCFLYAASKHTGQGQRHILCESSHGMRRLERSRDGLARRISHQKGTKRATTVHPLERQARRGDVPITEEVMVEYERDDYCHEVSTQVVMSKIGISR